jgi:NADH dehydrogenase (ubiquinone) 1 alpha subcomplex subunit 6
MYSLNLPVSTLRTKIRQEFERHRYVNQLRTVDVLLFSSHQEFQVYNSFSPNTYRLQFVQVI